MFIALLGHWRWKTDTKGVTVSSPSRVIMDTKKLKLNVFLLVCIKMGIQLIKLHANTFSLIIKRATS